MKIKKTHFDRDGHPVCGNHLFGNTPQLTGDRGHVDCERCLSILGFGRYQWSDVKPCGTRAAYRRHLRRGEKACTSCLQAERRLRRAA